MEKERFLEIANKLSECNITSEEWRELDIIMQRCFQKKIKNSIQKIFFDNKDFVISVNADNEKDYSIEVAQSKI